MSLGEPPCSRVISMNKIGHIICLDPQYTRVTSTGSLGRTWSKGQKVPVEINWEFLFKAIQWFGGS
jgi:hypothetical protein